MDFCRHTLTRAILIVLALCLVSAAPISADESKNDSGLSKAEKTKKRAEVQKMADQTLAKLYKAEPSAKSAIAKSAGYAAFSNLGMKILVAGGGTGKGLAVNNKTGKKTYMKMVEVQAGLGIGIKKFRVIWVFDHQSDYENFINQGFEFGGQATAAAKVNEDGGARQGAISVKEGVWIYQLTDQGVALELTLKGTKYYKNKQLN